MADTAETVPGEAPVGPESGSLAIRRWISIPLGLAATWGWIKGAPYAFAYVPVEGEFAAAAVFYLLLFFPLALLALGLGWLCRVRVLRAGDAPVGWSAAGFAIGVAGLLLAFALSWLNGRVVTGPAGGAGIAALLGGLGVIVVQAGAEEVLVRGWLQRVLGKLVTPFAGILLAAFLFAVLHLVSGPVHWQSFVNIVLAGVLFGSLADRSGGLAAPVGAHVAWNATEDLGLGLVPNPGSGPFGSVADFELAGAVLWGGGGEGLNTSIGTTLVLVALIVPLFALPRPGGVRDPQAAPA
ncbi:hypothetical protein GCM10011371_19730 [Novosphingobium marinum]|uniref:CAAX prenyl protease 2/Lysostaphin resistance protein A-like domain-containing protein n=1 Tax=Novosphingobium marinum TaxID=1514948 RepID=A0A7Y9XWV5_9SPHN|nr:type II CAAX endopeptidase family protein [Novosphingobium marinum]NYH96086.1 hypothetical protein [Novosphingobium marinum]GGC32353.1 hypothetical protein GCM10011371_19730 [Novosphingobium marinum]